MADGQKNGLVVNGVATEQVTLTNFNVVVLKKQGYFKN